MLSSFLEALSAHARGQSQELAEQLGQAAGQRAERLEAAHQRLAGTLGEDHPRVAALRDRSAVLRDLGAASAEAAGGRQMRRKRRPQEWAAQGRVVDSRGRPLSGLTVRVVDREGQFAEVLGDTETDADGAFHLSFHRRVFGGQPPELLLVVEGSEGRTLAASQRPVRPQPGRTDFYEVVVPTERR